MKKYRSLLIIALACLLVSNFSIAQDNVPEPVDPDKKENNADKDENQTQENKKVYDVSLVFKKGMKFKESAVVNIDQVVDTGFERIEQSILTDIEIDYDILKAENGKMKQAKLIFSKFKIIASANGRRIDASKEPGFHCIAKYDKDDKATFESMSEDFPEELKTELEKLNLTNYYPPSKGVKIGEEWKVDKDYLLKQFAQYEMEKVESTMKLEKVTIKVDGEKKIEIANIKITTEFEGKDIATSLEMTGNAEGTILIDTTNHRILENSSVVKVSGKGEGVKVENTTTLTDKFTYDDQLQTRPNKKDNNLQPKTDDE